MAYSTTLGLICVQNNVAFNVMGHAFYLEDGTEVNNVIQVQTSARLGLPWQADCIIRCRTMNAEARLGFVCRLCSDQHLPCHEVMLHHPVPGSQHEFPWLCESSMLTVAC